MKKYQHITPYMNQHFTEKERKNVYTAILVDINTVNIIFNTK